MQVISDKPDYDIIVVGGGAAGFFAAIQAAELSPGLHILIIEKTTKILSKVKVSGGGRCNVTHQCYDPIKLSHHYPRGEKKLKTLFKAYHAKHVVEWFASKGIELHAEEDGRMFPVTNDSQTIIDCFLSEVHRLKIKILLNTNIDQITKHGNILVLRSVDKKQFTAKSVVIASGGNANFSTYQWIQEIGHTIVPPIPSLFTFNDAEKNFKDLMGVAVPNAEIRIATTKFSQQGPLLITHWGLSGPAVIKLSAWAAEYLYEKKYVFTAIVSWIGPSTEERIRKELLQYKAEHGKQKVCLHPLYNLPQRLWDKLCSLAGVVPGKAWAELPQKNMNKLMELLFRCPFQIKGKTTFKEEFVTCGGVDLAEVDTDTMESKKVKNIYFAGEVLHIDGETGGFNFQAAWTTAYLCAKAIVEKAKLD